MDNLHVTVSVAGGGEHTLHLGGKHAVPTSPVDVDADLGEEVAVAVLSLIGAICTLVYVYLAMGAMSSTSNFKLGPAFITLLLSSFTGLTTVAFIKQPSTLGLLDVVAGTSPSSRSSCRWPWPSSIYLHMTCARMC